MFFIGHCISMYVCYMLHVYVKAYLYIYISIRSILICQFTYVFSNEIGGSEIMEAPKFAGWFVVENPIKFHDLGVAMFWEIFVCQC